jgi:3',5'-cyclic AMP phosphodiesterase CpdA
MKKRFGLFFVSLLMALVLTVVPAVAADPLYFVQITDTHWGDADHLERTQKAVEAINALPMAIQCVVHTGDVTSHNKVDDEASIAKGMEFLKKLKAPLHFVAGNNDILPWRYAATRDAFIKHFGPLVSTKEYAGIVFVMIYMESLATGNLTRDGYAPLTALEEALKAAGGKPVIVFQHGAGVEDFYSNIMHPGWKAEIRNQWVSILNAYNVRAVIAGHFHRDEHHWLGKVPVYISPPISGLWGRQATFRIYEYRDGTVGYRTQYLP